MSILFKYSSINRGKTRPINQNAPVESMSGFKKTAIRISTRNTRKWKCTNTWVIYINMTVDHSVQLQGDKRLQWANTALQGSNTLTSYTTPLPGDTWILLAQTWSKIIYLLLTDKYLSEIKMRPLVWDQNEATYEADEQLPIIVSFHYYNLYF